VQRFTHSPTSPTKSDLHIWLSLNKQAACPEPNESHLKSGFIINAIQAFKLGGESGAREKLSLLWVIAGCAPSANVSLYVASGRAA
jgi:hypothetical protein